MRFLCSRNDSLIFSCDHSNGFHRQQLILTIKEYPVNRKDDPFLVEKMLDELEGAFLWRLDGLHRLIANGYSFTIGNRSVGNVELICKSNNNISNFLQSEEYIRFKIDAESGSKTTYEAYKMWCEDNALHTLAANHLSSGLVQSEKKYNAGATDSIYPVRGKQVRGFAGIEVLVRPSL